MAQSSERDLVGKIYAGGMALAFGGLLALGWSATNAIDNADHADGIVDASTPTFEGATRLTTALKKLTAYLDGKENLDLDEAEAKPLATRLREITTSREAARLAQKDTLMAAGDAELIFGVPRGQFRLDVAYGGGAGVATGIAMAMAASSRWRATRVAA